MGRELVTPWKPSTHTPSPGQRKYPPVLGGTSDLRAGSGPHWEPGTPFTRTGKRQPLGGGVGPPGGRGSPPSTTITEGAGVGYYLKTNPRPDAGSPRADSLPRPFHQTKRSGGATLGVGTSYENKERR